MSDLTERVKLFRAGQLPGMGFGAHLGTIYLVEDLVSEIESLTSENTRLRALLEEIPWDDVVFAERLVCPFETHNALARRLLAIKEKIE